MAPETYLLTSDGVDGLNVKYKLHYSRLRTALTRRGRTLVEHTSASDTIHEDFLDAEADDMPIRLYLRDAVTKTELEDIDDELNGAIWFASLLSRVDGLVVMDHSPRDA